MTTELHPGATELDLRLYEQMALVRRFEEAAYRAYEQGEVVGTIHVSIGQEAVSVGVTSALAPDDRVLSHHRGHGHALAKGVDPGRLMAELLGRATGCSRGKGGSMHATDLSVNFLGSFAVVGGSAPLAVGSALAAKSLRPGELCAVFFGDGALAQGVVYESFNYATIWQLPVLFVCENNGYAISTRSDYSIGGPGLVERARAFGLRAERVDGQDVRAVREAALELVEGVRRGEAAVLECATYRYMGHSRGDPAHGIYRSEDEWQRWRDRDPLRVLAAGASIAEQETERIETGVRERIEQALEFARSSPPPPLEWAMEDVWGEGTGDGARPVAVRPPAGAPALGEPFEATYAEALRQALEDAMAEDERVFVMGQDSVAGFPFGATRGLADLYGLDRIRNTPICEASTMGLGTGAAVGGLRPVVEVDFSAFMLLGFDQLVNNAAKLRYVSGGQLRVPLVVRVGQGPLGSFAAQHSQLLQGWLANVPGLCVAAPSSVQDAYDLLRWSLRQGDPVVFAEDMRLYRTKGDLRRGPGADDPRPRVVRPGRDATAITFGWDTKLALDAAEELAREGIELEVLDLRLVSPLDGDPIEESVRRTRRVLCVSDDPLTGGMSATLAAVAAERGHGALLAPVLRLGARHAPAPYAPDLEKRIYPSAASIATAVRELVRWES